MIRRFRQTAVPAALALALATGCANTWTGSDYFEHTARIDEADAYVAGEALAQRKQEMERAKGDLVHFHATLRSLRRHKSEMDIQAFEAFLRPYLAERVDPLVAPDQAGWHPELQRLDANLLFAKGAVLVELRDHRAIDRLLRQIERRYADLDDLLVEFPMGKQTTLARGVRELTRQRFAL